MLKNRFVPSILSLALLTSSVPCAAKKSYHDEGPNVGAIVAGVGAAVAGVGALIWALQPDDPEIVVNKSQAAYHDLLVKYQEAIDKICRPGISARFIDESVLYASALAGIPNRCYYIHSDISALSSAIDTTEKAIRRAKSDCVKDELRITADKLRRLKKELAEVEECLRVHRAYFDLFELQAKLSASHAREIDAAKTPVILLCGATHPEINACLNVRYSSYDAEWKYPYYAYAKKCVQDIRDLERAIATASSSYRSLRDSSQNLLSILKYVHTYVVNAPEYQSNIRDRERERLERERLELEQARLRAEQERARAERERARAEQERVNLEHARLCAERDRVALENARLREERLNNLNNARHYCSICAHEWYAIADRCNCHCCC